MIGIISRYRVVQTLLLLTGVSLAAASTEAQSVTSLAISPGQPAVSIGATTQLSATATYSNGSTSDVSSSVSWSSADPRIVSVSAKGLASGSATGNVAITASYQGQSATTTISSSIGDIQWSGPLTITKGGTYSGNFKSTNPGVPAISVNTSDPVTIENSYLSSGASLILDAVYGSKLTVKNTIGIGANPNVAGQTNGLFIDAQHPALLDVENNYWENVLYGIWVRGYGGNSDGTQTITILNNRGHNMLGLHSDGKGGYQSGESSWSQSHAVMLSNVNAVPGMQIAWNEIVNYPYQSKVEENLIFFEAGGTPGSPLSIHDNYIQGSYSYDPATDGSATSGGIVTDGSTADNAQTATAYLDIHDNQIVGTVNIGLELSAGHDTTAYNNRVISSGLLADGTHIPAQNVGVAVYDVYGNASRGTFYNNNMYSNTVGWMCWAARCAFNGHRNDSYFPSNAGDYATNPSIAANPITLAMEADEYSSWLGKVGSSGHAVGPQVASASTGGSGGGSGSGSGGGSNTSISSTSWYNVVNTNSTLCLGVSGSGTGNGTAVAQNTCGAQSSQQWQFQPTDSGYYKVVNRNAQTMVWDVTGGAWATANQIPVEIWIQNGGANQQWMPVSVGNGAYKFVARHSSKCLDVPGASSAVVQLQQYDCNGTVAQSFTLTTK